MQALIEKANQSNVTKKQFCRHEGIPLSVFYYWQKKHKKGSQSTSKGFLPVEINSKPPPQTHSTVEIAFPNGVIVRFEGSHDIEIIRSLITRYECVNVRRCEGRNVIM